MNTSSGSPRAPESPVAIWMPRAIAFVFFLFLLGFLFHTSPFPILLGKYNERYLAFLFLLYFILLPLVYVTARFLFTPSELKRSGGRTLVITPARKLAVGFVLLLLGYIGASWWIGRLLSANVSTHNAHVFHPYLQNVPRPHHAEQHVNRWGFKGDEIELQKPAGVVRIFVFGGSTVHCGTVPFESTHVRLLEKRLKQEHPHSKLEVQNLGAEWHTTQHDAIKLLFDVQEFSPDIVVMFHGINDLVRSFEGELFTEGPYRQDYRHYYGAVANLARPQRTAINFFNTAGGHWFSDFRFQQVKLAGPEGNGLNGMLTMFFPKSVPVEITEWNSLPAFERNLQTFVKTAKTNQYEVVLGTQPSLYREDLSEADQQVLAFPKSHQFDGKHASLKSMIAGLAKYNEVTRKIASENGVPLVDLDTAVPKTTEYMYDDVHFTRRGNETVAQAIADKIIEAKLIGRALDKRAGGK